MPSGAFMLHRQVHVDSLLRAVTDKVDMGYVARETSPYWPSISSIISHITMNAQYIFFPPKTLVENPQHATTEWSQLET